jgi:membrane protein implicated in regulation of membrane protease activity
VPADAEPENDRLRVRAPGQAPYTYARREVRLTIVWIAVGVVLIAVELHHMAFYALFAALGCFAAAAVASVSPEAIAVQVATAVVVAAAGIVLVRGRVSRAFAHHYDVEHVPGVHGGLIGQEVLTLDVVGGRGQVGHVQLAGERWRAVSGSDVPIPAGTSVLVTAVRGTTLTVWPVDGHLPPHDGRRDLGEGNREGEQS